MALGASRPVRCRIRMAGVPCSEPGLYLVRFEDCGVDTCDGRIFCIGHHACVEHAAALRTGQYKISDGPRVARESLADVWEIAGAAR